MSTKNFIKRLDNGTMVFTSNENIKVDKKIRCRKCLELLDGYLFLPKERIIDGKAHLCKRCERDINIAAFVCDQCGDGSGKCECFLELESIFELDI